MGPRQRDNTRRPLGGQSGFTLIEVIIAMGLAGILTTALSAGILFMFTANTAISRDQELRRVLANFAESLKSLDYVSCLEPEIADPAQDDSIAMRQKYVEALDTSGVIEVVDNFVDDPVLKPAEDWRPIEDITVEVVGVQFWDKKVAAAGDIGAFVVECPSGTDQGAQILTIEARLDGETVSTQVVKANREDVEPPPPEGT
jgi:prepilin-type N-terminal cleavage/methylation domain-containing protein